MNEAGRTIGIIMIFVVCVFGDFFCYLGTKDTVVAKVRKTEIKRVDDSDIYMIFTDKGVFKNTDRVWALKCNSSDLYNDIEVGKTYRFEVEGFRIKACSKYKNIIEAEEIK